VEAPVAAKSVEEYIVPWVREAESYSDRHLEWAWQHPEVVRMMSNENPIPPSEAVLDAILEAGRMGNLYPDTGPKLRQKLGEAAGLGADNVMLGNGSTDVLNVILETFVAPGDEVVIAVPTFSMYETRARVNGAIPVLVPMTPDFYWDVDGIIKAVTEKTKLIFICTPNNPIGNQIDERDLRRILDVGVPTVIDEAYYELEEEPRTLAYLIREYPHAIINRTMSKAFGLAGLRVGYALADERVISYMSRMKIPWNVSLIALAAALAALEDEADQHRKYANNRDGRRYLHDAINAIPGLQAFTSEGNFVLIDASALGKTSTQIKDDLIARGVFIRPMSPHHMKEGFVRVTVGTPEQNRMFIETLRAYVDEIKGG
jgi:histidinol-phosphate aminotransferase